MIDFLVNDTAQLVHFADNCNGDRRFIEKHWVESPETIRGLMTTGPFKDSLIRLRRGIPLTDGDHVAALFHARETVAKKNGAKPVSWVPHNSH